MTQLVFALLGTMGAQTISGSKTDRWLLLKLSCTCVIKVQDVPSSHLGIFDDREFCHSFHHLLCRN